MSWSWDSSSWRKSSKILLLLATIWPFIYMFLFFGLFITIFWIAIDSESHGRQNCGNLDALQLDEKIKAGQISELRVEGSDFFAVDRTSGCMYRAFIINESSRSQLLTDAREVVDNRPRVDKVEQKPAREMPENPFAALGGVAFGLLTTLHLVTMILMMAQMPFYVVLAVKNERLDQTTRIIWIVILAVMSALAAPVYWYLYIWRKPISNSPPLAEAI